MFTLNGLERSSDTDVQIETLRTLLLDFDTIDDFDSSPELTINNPWVFAGLRTTDTVEWLWTHAALAFHGKELLYFRAKLANFLLFRCNLNSSHDFDDEIYRVLIRLLDDEMVAEYLKGSYTFLPTLFSARWSVYSKFRGDTFLSLLASLHLDVEACVVKELEHLPDGCIAHHNDNFHKKRMIFENDHMQTPILRWEWAYDVHAPGYLVTSEFSSLASDVDCSWVGSEWPFLDYGWFGSKADYEHEMLKPSRRFDRRAAAKACKERSRTDQKRTRSKMPGTWNW
jgi:hypothetical protein